MSHWREVCLAQGLFGTLHLCISLADDADLKLQRALFQNLRTVMAATRGEDAPWMPPCLFGVGRKSVSGSLFTSILEYVERQHCLHKVSCDVLCVCVPTAAILRDRLPSRALRQHSWAPLHKPAPPRHLSLEKCLEALDLAIRCGNPVHLAI